jgi:hypothetical protein
MAKLASPKRPAFVILEIDDKILDQTMYRNHVVWMACYASPDVFSWKQIKE